LEDLRKYDIAVILMDINMPIMTGIEAVKLIRSKFIETPVIMLTIFDDDENIYNAICAGANGYLLKSDLDRVSPAITEVLNGGAPLTGSVAKRILNNVRSPVTLSLNAPTSKLSPKETEILESLARGNSYKMISNELKLSIDTVRTHIRSIYKKLQVNSALEAINKIKI
jgi:DNA-binding NarL/FixJ family response regulator